MPRALLIYPEIPPSYWSEKYALEFIGRKAPMPPLGLLTLASLFPRGWELRLVDMNVRPLSDADILWADYAFVSAMIVQRESFQAVVSHCKLFDLPVIAGGPYPTSFYEEISGVDHIMRGEVELCFADFLLAILDGNAPAICDPPSEFPPMEAVPPPRYDLLNLTHYASMAVQFSRGCPYNCEFCDITKLYGRLPRTKSNHQVLAELQLLYDLGWKGTVFFVDDNFIGNRSRAKRLLPEIASWQRQKEYPFSLYTEASVNLAEMPDLMNCMADAGFDMVFLGLETPNPAALLKANKGHNIKTDDPDYLLDAVRKIQQHGLEVTAGFILGLDGDDESCFDSQILFVQEAGIPTAMVGLLTALKGTDLYERLQREGRLIEESTGNNVSASLNFRATIAADRLIAGYKRVLSTLYDRRLSNYFKRCYTLLLNWDQRSYCTRPVRIMELRAFLMSIFRQLFSCQGPAYASFFIKVLLRKPRMISEAVRLAIMGYHYEKVTRQQVLVDEFRSFLEIERARLQDAIAYYRRLGENHVSEATRYLHDRLAMVQRRYHAIHKDFRSAVDDALESFYDLLQDQLEGFPKRRPGGTF